MGAAKTKSEVLSLLLALGDTPDQVAESLHELGVKGRPGSSCRCVVANYLHDQGVTDVEVCPEHGIEWGWFDLPCHARKLTKQDVPAVLMMASGFDIGIYPQLELPQHPEEPTA